MTIARAPQIKDKGAVANTVEPESDTRSIRRLVVRVKIPVDEPPAPVRQPLSRGALLVGAVVVAVVLAWLGIRMFRSEPTPARLEPTPAPAVTEAVPAEVVPTSQPQLPARAPPTPEPQVRQQPAAAPPSAVNEVIPNVSRSARDTIRGTIRVSIRVIVDQGGNVVAATADEPGPSRYFERLSLEAARKWTFAPTGSAEQRVMMVRFYFKRTGTTARASPAP